MFHQGYYFIGMVDINCFPFNQLIRNLLKSLIQEPVQSLCCIRHFELKCFELDFQILNFLFLLSYHLHGWLMKLNPCQDSSLQHEPPPLLYSSWFYLVTSCCSLAFLLVVQERLRNEMILLRSCIPNGMWRLVFLSKVQRTYLVNESQTKFSFELDLFSKSAIFFLSDNSYHKQYWNSDTALRHFMSMSMSKLLNIFIQKHSIHSSLFPPLAWRYNCKEPEFNDQH